MTIPDNVPSSRHSGVIRRLAAIVVADVVGYTRLMERDDAGTLARLTNIRKNLIDPTIVEYGGNIVKTAGDGMLLEFNSADAALRCAIHVQRAMHADNQSQSADERIEFRIGINLGDIIVDGTDIAGDGVNVAARLEALAEPGGICVSAAVREQVHGSLDVAFDDIGEQQVKNIMRPIRVFAVALRSTAAPHPAIRQTDARPEHAAPATLSLSTHAIARRRGLWAAFFFALVAVGLFVLWWNSQTPRLPEPPAMSVAVFPLIAPPGNPAITQWAESLTRDLSAQLARADVGILTVPVPGRQSVPASGGIGELARALNVRYVLEGEVQPGQEMTEIRLRLVNGASGEQLWNETVSLKEPAAATDQTRSVRPAIERLRARLLQLEMRRVTAGSGVATSAMDYVLRAQALNTGQKSLDRFRRQEALLDEALRRDPDLVPALLGVYNVLDGELDVDTNVDRDRLIRRMDEVTSRAVNLNRESAITWDARSAVLMYMGRWDAALEANAKAIQLDPDAAWLVAGRAWLMSMVGRPAAAVTLVAQAIAMDPAGSWWNIRVACEAHLLLGQYDDAIAACEKATGQTGEEFDIAYFLAAAYAHKGATERAAEEKAKILHRSPGFTIATLKAKRYSVHPEYMRLAEAQWYSGLRKAGIPEK